MARRRVSNPRKSAGRRSRSGRTRPAQQRYAKYIVDVGVFFITLLIGVAALFAYIARDLPDTSAMWRHTGAPKIMLLADDGSPISVNGASAGAPMRLANLPDHVPKAILAVEDRNFYHHFGANPVSVLRALMVNVGAGKVRQGGSTITQQLAKNVFLSADRTLKRKAQEFILALWLEHKFTKDEILTLYLNRVYFGAGAYGIDAASYRYFGKPASKLSMGEAAVLAGLLKAPSRLAPTNNPQDAGRRGRTVINQMLAAGFITKDQAEEAISKPILLSTSKLSAAPYFIDHALARVRDLAGEVDADLIVRTTFDPRMQQAAETGVLIGSASMTITIDDAQTAAVIMNGEGAVKAMIGGRDYRESQFNRAVQSNRQPGSAFKPFVYLAAVENGLHAETLVDDAPLRIGKWAPDNYKSKYYGEVTFREALARSLNGATIRVQEAVGRSAVRKVARDMGWTGALTPGPSLALGVDGVSPLALAGSYAPLANGGFKIEPHVIMRIETADGDLIYQRAGAYLSQAASVAAIDELNSMMESVVEWGTGKAAAVPGYAVAGKTGTSQDSRDAWFAGHAGGLLCVIWVGRDDNSPMPGVTGGTAPAVIWREIMARALPPRYIAPIEPVINDDPIAALLSASG